MQNKKKTSNRTNYIEKWLNYWKQTLDFCTFKIWFIDTKPLPFWQKACVETYKTLAVTTKKYKSDHCMERASALSFYSMLAVVPMLAIAFGFAGGFGFEETLQNLLSKASGTDSVFWNTIFDFARNMLRNTNSGIIGGVGLILLFWIIINVMTRIEIALNRIWEIKKHRTLLRKATDYITLLVLTPMLIFVAVSAKTYVSEHLVEMVDISFFQFLGKHILSLTPFFASIFLICLIYIILPNRKMPIKPTIISGIITGVSFMIVQILYIKLQVYMTSYNIVYGSFAALPLFLIWLRISWVILLMGAELGFSIYRKNQYIFETDYRHLSEFRKKIYALEMMIIIVKNFEDKKGGLNIQDLSLQMKTPQPHLYRIAQELSETGILSCVFSNDSKYAYTSVYQPAFDTHTLKLHDILNALDLHDYKEEFNPQNSESYDYCQKYITKLSKAEENSELNVLVRDLDWTKAKQQ